MNNELNNQNNMNNSENVSNDTMVNNSVNNTSTGVESTVIQPEQSHFESVEPVQSAQPVESVKLNEQPVNPAVEAFNQMTGQQSQPEQSHVEAVQSVQPVEVEQKPLQSSQTVSNNKKKKLPVIIAIVVVIIALIAGCVVVYNNSKPSAIFKSSINNIYRSLNDNIKKSTNTLSTSFELQTNIKTNEEDSNQYLDILNNLKIKAECGIDYKNKKMSLGVDTKYENKDLLSGNIYFSDNNAYIYLNDLYNKYISTELDDYDEMFDSAFSKKDTTVVMASVRNAVLKSLKDEYFVKTKENGLNKNTIKVTSKVANEIIINVLKELKNDKKFVETFAKLSDKSKDEINGFLDGLVTSFVDEPVFDDSTHFEISIYTKGLLNNNFSKLEVIATADDESQRLIISKLRDDKYNVEYIEGVEEILGGYLTIKPEKNNTTIISDLSVSDVKLGFTLKYNTSYNTKFNTKDVSNSVKIEELSETDIDTIMTKLMEKDGFQQLYGAFSTLDLDTSSLEDDDYDYDYDYDDDYDDYEL